MVAFVIWICSLRPLLPSQSSAYRAMSWVWPSVRLTSIEKLVFEYQQAAMRLAPLGVSRRGGRWCWWPRYMSFGRRQ